MLIFITIVLVLINVFVIGNYDYYERRLIRVVSVSIYFFVFFLFKGAKDRKILLMFMLLVSVDALGLFYDKGITSLICTTLKLMAYFLVVNVVIKKVKFHNITRPIFLFFGLVILLNLVLIYQTVWTTFDKINDIAEILYYIIYGSMSVVICVAAINYNFRYGSKRSRFFLYFVFALTFSDASWFIGYYLNSKLAFHFDVLFYLLGLYYISIYALETKNEDDVLPYEE